MIVDKIWKLTNVGRVGRTPRSSPPMLATDPWGIGTVGGPRMEVFMRLRREMPPDYIG
jgi:hypothetical protein